MNEITVEMKEVLADKLAMASEYPIYGVDFTPEEAEMAGFFVEDAISFEDVEDSVIDVEVENG